MFACDGKQWGIVTVLYATVVCAFNEGQLTGLIDATMNVSVLCPTLSPRHYSRRVILHATLVNIPHLLQFLVVFCKTAYAEGLVAQPAGGAARGFERVGVEDIGMSELSLERSTAAPTTRLPLRPGFGKLGSPVMLLANHFVLQFNKDATDFAVHYDVDIRNTREMTASTGGRRSGKGQQEGGHPSAAGADRTDKPLPAAVGRGVMKVLSERENWPVGWCYDGKKNIYTPGIFPALGKGEVHEFMVQWDEKGDGRLRTFAVAIKRVGVVSFNALRTWVQNGQGDVPADAIVALDIVLRHRVSMIPDTISFARAIFLPHDSTSFRLGGGADVWLGYHQSSRPCQRGISIIINQAASAFVHAGPMLELFLEAGRLSDRDMAQGIRPDTNAFRQISKAVRGVKVVVSHHKKRTTNPKKRTYRVTGLSRLSAREETFDYGELGQISIEHYFQEKHELQLQYPHLPCLQVSSRGCRIPPEICTIVAGMRVRKLSPQQSDSMIRIAACEPAVKQRSIQTQVSQNLKFAQDPQVAAFGLNVAPGMAEVKARVLDAPVLQYKQPSQFRVSGGRWNLKQCKFLVPGAMNIWGIMCFVPRDAMGMEPFITHFQRKLSEIGINCPTAPMKQFLPQYPPHALNQGVEGAMEALNKAAQAKYNGKSLDLILCIMPFRDTELYRAIKLAGDSRFGIITQCLVATSAGITKENSRQDQYIANVAMKVNSKLGGTNVATTFSRPILPREKPFMVIGADVTHPGVGSKNTTPSIAAVVGSLDAYCSKYAAKIMAQEHRVEIVADLQVAVAALLMEFYRNTGGKKPEQIIFYRDGVADGQFQHVLEQELPRLRKACAEVSGNDYQPNITFVVVQKRHMTRLFPKTQDGGDRNGNLLPGTVIDTDICHPHEYDFFLNSHEGIQGTVRPAHYHVLLDENKFTADQLQLFTHHLCYLYCRCTRSVSIVPPAYYAHLAAERGRLLCRAYHDDSESDAASSRSGNDNQGALTDLASLSEINAVLSGRMFFV